MYQLQNRWKLETKTLQYYGMRHPPFLFCNRIRLSRKMLAVVQALPLEEGDRRIKTIRPLIDQGIVVLDEAMRKTPTSIDEARFCVSCVANDFIIPGLEFDDEGLCPMCATADQTEGFKSVVPIMKHIPQTTKSLFDVALFYTGGKDSTFLLYHLSEVLHLRVLALTWEIPTMSESAKASIAAAKSRFPNVAFIAKKMADTDLKKIYRKLYMLNDNICACPSIAYILFFPLLAQLRVPYFLLGNEPAQMKNLYYNHLAPAVAFKSANTKWFLYLTNILRILTLHLPLKRGQFHTLMTMKQLAKKKSILFRLTPYKNELVRHVIEAIHEVPAFIKPFKRSVRIASWTNRIPAFVHLDFDDISDTRYDWRHVKELIIQKAGWVPPQDSVKGLHTSCSIEKCKEQSQFLRFYHQKSTMIPFSAIEIALASKARNLSNDEALKEIKESMGFALEEVPECQIMKDYLNAQ